MSREKLPSVDEDDVVEQTEIVFNNFFLERAHIEQNSDLERYFLECSPTVTTGNNTLADVGRQLARIGDDVNNQYKDQFEELASRIDLTSEGAYDSFVKFVSGLYQTNMAEQNWGQVLTLFCFGYYLAKRYMGIVSIDNIFSTIRDCIVHFVRDKLAKWIRDQGGWIALQYTTSANLAVHFLCFIGVFVIGYFIYKRISHS